LLHGYGDDANERFLIFVTIQLTAYADESGTERIDFVLAGYLGSAVEWLGVEQTWKDTLRKHHLGEFHMRDCYAGEGEFEGRADRLAIAKEFVSIVEDAALVGAAIRIDRGSFLDVQRQLAASIDQGFNKDYLHGFSAFLRLMVDQVTHYPAEEKIQFVFDSGQFAGRAVELYAFIKTHDRSLARGRLSGISIQDSKETVLLQAADSLAHRVHRHFLNAESVELTKVAYMDSVPVWLIGSAIAPEPKSR
jgi:hypothetical protein